MAGHLLSHYAPQLSNRGAAPPYDEQRIEWARGLSEMVVRALASEYLMGKRDDCSVDAYHEYLRRWPDEDNDPSGSKKRKQQALKKRKRAR